MSTPTVHTFYQSNIPTRMVEAQARVFTHLDIPLKQWKDDKTTHCEWINTVMRDESLGPLTIIADIDAFPLSRAGFDRLVAQRVAALWRVSRRLQTTKIPAGYMPRRCFWPYSAASITR